MIRSKYYLLLYILLWMVACRPLDAPEAEKILNASFQCAFDSINLQHSLFLRVSELKIKLADLPACDNLPDSARQDYQIPDSAQSAAISWYAGSGAYFFLIQDEKEVRIHRALVEEEQSSQPSYELYAAYKNGKFHFNHIQE